MTTTGNERVYERYRTAGTRGTALEAAWEGYAEYERLGWLPRDRAARVLDLGCGAGEFLEYLRHLGYSNIAGVDYSPEQVAWCRERGLTSVEQVRDTRVYLREHQRAFDCIVMNNVLEHVPKAEIIPLLTLIRETLPVGGCLIIQVPNMANVFGLAARYLDFTHEVGFTEHSLRQVLVAAGHAEADVAIAGLPVRLKATPRRILFWSMNRLYATIHRAAYVAAVGVDAPTIYSKLVMARATVR